MSKVQEKTTLASINAQVDAILHEQNSLSSFFEIIERKTNVKRLYVVYGLFAFFSLFMILSHFSVLVCNLVGFVYPAYRSIKALESPDKDDDNRWLTYWVVFALYSVVDFWADAIFRYFPFYWLVKVIFLTWCFLPIANNGSVFVYNRLIRPFFLRHKSRIDTTASKLIEQVNKLAEKDE